MWIRYDNVANKYVYSEDQGVTWNDLVLKNPISFPDGSNIAPGVAFANDPDTGLYRAGSGNVQFVANTNVVGGFLYSSSNGTIWANRISLGGLLDTILVRDAANVLALKNGTNPQEFRIYGTTTGPKWAGIITDSVGSLYFRSGSGANRWFISGSDGALKAATDATVDIGGDGVNRPRDLFISRNAKLGGTLEWGGGSAIASSNAVALLAYPVGSIYISTVNTNPGTLFGGTWVAFGAGKVLVGLDGADTDFDTAEETGGAKTHTLGSTEVPNHGHTASATTGITPNPHAHQYYRVGYAGSVYNTGSAAGGGSAVDGGYVTLSAVTTVTINDTAGGGGAHNNLQPYIVVYMWKRTA